MDTTPWLSWLPHAAGRTGLAQALRQRRGGRRRVGRGKAAGCRLHSGHGQQTGAQGPGSSPQLPCLRDVAVPRGGCGYEQKGTNVGMWKCPDLGDSGELWRGCPASQGHKGPCASLRALPTPTPPVLQQIPLCSLQGSGAVPWRPLSAFEGRRRCCLNCFKKNPDWAVLSASSESEERPLGPRGAMREKQRSLDPQPECHAAPWTFLQVHICLPVRQAARGQVPCMASLRDLLYRRRSGTICSRLEAVNGPSRSVLRALGKGRKCWGQVSSF